MPLKACTGCGLPGPWGKGSRCPGCKTPANVHSNPARGTAGYQSTRRAVFERDGYVCRWCGAQLERTPGDGGRPPELDHVVPRVRALGAGWSEEQINHPSNLTAACLPCNRSRGARGGRSRRR